MLLVGSLGALVNLLPLFIFLESYNKYRSGLLPLTASQRFRAASFTAALSSLFGCSPWYKNKIKN